MFPWARNMSRKVKGKGKQTQKTDFNGKNSKVNCKSITLLMSAFALLMETFTLVQCINDGPHQDQNKFISSNYWQYIIMSKNSCSF